MRLISRLEIAAIDFPFEKKARGESKDRGKVVETASSSGIDKWKPENIGGGYLALLSPVPPFRRSWTPLTRGRIRVSLPKFLRPYSPPSRGLCLEVIFLRRSKVEPRVSTSNLKKFSTKSCELCIHSFLSTLILNSKKESRKREKIETKFLHNYTIFLKIENFKKIIFERILIGGEGKKSKLVSRSTEKEARCFYAVSSSSSSFFFPLSLLPSTIYPFSNVCPRHERKCRRTGSTIFRRLLVPDFRPVFLHVAGCVGRAFISRCISRITIPDIHEFVPLIRVTSARRSSYPLVRRCLRPANGRRFEWTRFRKKEKAFKMSKAREKYFDRAVYLI